MLFRVLWWIGSSSWLFFSTTRWNGKMGVWVLIQVPWYLPTRGHCEHPKGHIGSRASPWMEIVLQFAWLPWLPSCLLWGNPMYLKQKREKGNTRTPVRHNPRHKKWAKQKKMMLMMWKDTWQPTNFGGTIGGQFRCGLHGKHWNVSSSSSERQKAEE